MEKITFKLNHYNLHIYGLKSPIDGKIVYVGATTHSLSHRLKQHYWHLNEVIKGTRKTNKRFEYLKSILPLKVNIVSLYETNDVNGWKFYESRYIAKYKEINPDLLNETDGGIGENTYKYKSKEEINEIGNKISNALIGKTKPDGFAEHLSFIRTGSGNPMAKPLKEKVYAIDINTCKKLRKEFNYGYEINSFLGKKNAWSNIKKALNHRNMRNGSHLTYQVCYGYYWLTGKDAEQYEFDEKII